MNYRKRRIWVSAFILYNLWIDSAGYTTCFGILSGINASILLIWVPLYLWGKQIRAWCMQLNLARYIFGGSLIVKLANDLIYICYSSLIVFLLLDLVVMRR